LGLPISVALEDLRSNTVNLRPNEEMTQISASDAPKPTYAGFVPAATWFRTVALKLSSRADTTRTLSESAMSSRREEGDHWKLRTGPAKS
jgi:hypothetical protein